jgi:hypothetical protein
MPLVNWDPNSYLSSFDGGARQYLFLVSFNFPFGSKSSPNILVRSTSTPDSNIEEVVIPYPGHQFRMAGSRNYGDWTISLNVDGNANVITDFSNWHDNIYEPRRRTSTVPTSYMSDQTLEMIGGGAYGLPTKTYKLINAWPKTIGQVALDYASQDIATIDITFAYQYYEVK